jgi:NTE family protein
MTSVGAGTEAGAARTPTLGIALGGGAELGIAHIGVLRVLERHGFFPHLVAGSSAGALVGAFYAAGVSVDAMERISLRMNWRAIQRMILPILALSTNEPLRRFLLKTIPAKSFDELKRPLRLVTTDLLSAEMVVFQGGPGFESCGLIDDSDVVLTEGDLLEAIRASCTRPVINRPVELDGRTLVDGCLTNNVPSFLVRDMGADVVVAVDLMAGRQRTRRPTNILAYALQTQSIHMHWALKSRHLAADVVIRPDFSFLGETDAFGRGEDVLKAGEVAAEPMVDAIRDALDKAATGTE